MIALAVVLGMKPLRTQATNSDSVSPRGYSAAGRVFKLYARALLQKITLTRWRRYETIALDSATIATVIAYAIGIEHVEAIPRRVILPNHWPHLRWWTNVRISR